MAGIKDYKVVTDDQNNPDPWFKPAGLSVVVAFDKALTPKAFNTINLRRAFLMWWDSRHPLPDSKISRRSRRRWRGKGGVWQFDPKLTEILTNAARKCAQL